MLTQPDRIDRFEVVDTIGRGGLGIVYEGWDPRLERPVAIKRLLQVAPRFLELFRQHARGAARIGVHPCFTTIFEYGDDKGSPFIVMELLDGAPVARGKAGPDSRARLIEVLVRACDGLAYAYSQGIAAHGGLKPSNIHVRANGEVRIMDLGMADLQTEIQHAQHQALSSTTHGTVAYVSPEQVYGAKLDSQSDVWSLGVILYELCYGQVPFPGTNPVTVLRAITEHDPPFAHIEGDPADRLRHVVVRALERDRSVRYAGPAELAQDLTDCLRSSGFTGVVAPLPANQEALQAGETALASGQLDAAREQFLRAVQLSPSDPVALKRLRYCDQVIRRHARANEMHRLAMQMFDAKDYDTAVVVLQQLRELQPDNDDVTTLLGWAKEARDRAQRSRPEPRPQAPPAWVRHPAAGASIAPATPQTATPQTATPRPATPRPATPQPATPRPATPRPATPLPTPRRSAAPAPAHASPRPAPIEIDPVMAMAERLARDKANPPRDTAFRRISRWLQRQLIR